MNTEFWKVSIDDNDTWIIEAVTSYIAANIYAAKTGIHPYTIRCSCCGPIGWVSNLFPDEVLEYMEQACNFIFDYEYTADDILLGSGKRYDVRDQYKYMLCNQ